MTDHSELIARLEKRAPYFGICGEAAAALREQAGNLEEAKRIAIFQAKRLAEQAGEIERLKGQLVSGFYEEALPVFEQGEPHHELQYLVTAEECQAYIDNSAKLIARLSEAEALRLAAEAERDTLASESAAHKACWQALDDDARALRSENARLSTWYGEVEAQRNALTTTLAEQAARISTLESNSGAL